MGLIAAIVLCLWALPAFAQTTPIRAWNVTSGGKPYGCTTWEDGQEGVWHTLTRFSGGPTGVDYLRMTAIQAGGTGDDGWGCRFPTQSAAVGHGATHYLRVYYRINSPVNWRSDACAVPPCDPNSRTSPDKLMIIADTCGSPGRIIMHQSADAPERSATRLRLTQGTGGAAPPAWVATAHDVWIAVQGKVVGSSDGAALDGATYLYVNNDTEGSPSASEVNIAIDSSQWSTSVCASGVVGVGDFSMNPLTDLDATASAIIDLAKWEYDDEFDPNWYADMAASVGPQTIPARTFRIRGADFAALGLIPVFLWRQRR